MAKQLVIRKGAAKAVESIEITQEVIAKLQELGHDPLVEMARYAIGDVVGLGFMTQDEFDAEDEYDEDFMLLTRSGRSRALELIPPKLRAEMSKELAGYIHRKLKPNDKALGEDIEANGMVFYLPENGREADVSQYQPKAVITDESDRD